MSRHEEIVTDVSLYSGSLLLTQFVTMGAAVLTRHFLGPVQTGVWSLVQVLLNYSEYAALGTLTAITLEIPFYHGKGDTQKAADIKNTVFSFSVVTSLFASAAVLVYAFWRRELLKTEFFYGLLFASGLILLQKMNGLLISLLRAYKFFGLASRQMLYSAVVNALLIAALSFRFRLYGFMTAMCLSFVFNIVYVFAFARFRFSFRLCAAELLPLIRFGLPLMAIALFTTFFETIDRLIISKYLGFEALGLYSIALMAYAYINSVPNAVGIVMIPNIQEKFGKTECKADLKDYLVKSNLVYSGFIPVLIGLGWFTAPLLVQWVLPEYVRGIPAMRFLVLSGYFVALSQAYLQFVYVIRRHMVFLPMLALSCSLAAVMNWLAVRWGYGIQGVGVATTMAMFFHFTMIQFYASSHILGWRETAKDWAAVMLKFAWMLALLLMIDGWAKLPDPVLTAALRLTLYFLAYSPVLVDVERRFQIVTILRKRLRLA